jgi:hypothetical protein
MRTEGQPFAEQDAADDQVAAVGRSRPGDPVRMCLTSIPKAGRRLVRYVLGAGTGLTPQTFPPQAASAA